MALKYKIVYTGGEAEIVEKKSRFIATVSPVKTEEEALAFIEAQKKILECQTQLFCLYCWKAAGADAMQ